MVMMILTLKVLAAISLLLVTLEQYYLIFDLGFLSFLLLQMFLTEKDKVVVVYKNCIFL